MNHPYRISKALAAAVCLHSIFCSFASAVDDLSALRLSIGPVYTQVPSSSSLFSTIEGSAAIGAYNQVLAPNSMTIGHGNAVYAADALSLGFWNTTGDTSLPGGDCSLTVGFLNVNRGVHCAVVGGYNNVDGGASAVIGDHHTFKGVGSLGVGYNNYVDAGVYFGAVIGSGLISATGNSLVVGTYNKTWTFEGPAADKPVFIVANGADSDTRNNALEVHFDGKVIISKRQGDILMGEFGNP